MSQGLMVSEWILNPDTSGPAKAKVECWSKYKRKYFEEINAFLYRVICTGRFKNKLIIRTVMQITFPLLDSNFSNIRAWLLEVIWGESVNQLVVSICSFFWSQFFDCRRETVLKYRCPRIFYNDINMPLLTRKVYSCKTLRKARTWGQVRIM
jgi:hypothetical protein